MLLRNREAGAARLLGACPVMPWLCRLEKREPIDTILRMFKSLLIAFILMGTLMAADLPSKKYLNLAAIKKMVVAAEAEATRQNVSVTICIVDENGALLFLQKGDGVSINT